MKLPLVAFLCLHRCSGFLSPAPSVVSPRNNPHKFGLQKRAELDDNDEDGEAARLQKQADALREQIRKMEATLGEERRSRSLQNDDTPSQKQEETTSEPPTTPSLHNKRVLVVGANGRLGSMACRELLRNHPTTQVVACVHYVGEDSPTNRGYGRLSYEVGAEDGIGTIGAAWSMEDRVATFEYAEYMKDYNLQNLRLVECELLDPIQCQSIAGELPIDSVIWCATDFNGNQPRAVSGLNIAFLFRAVASPTKGRVEIEGLRNMLGALKLAQQDREATRRLSSPSSTATATTSNRPTNFVLVTTSPAAFEDFETPYGTFNGLKREGEDILKEFPSLTSTVLQMSKYEDNFVDEGLDVRFDDRIADDKELSRRRINRRDAAKAAVQALTEQSFVGETKLVWTESR